LVEVLPQAEYAEEHLPGAMTRLRERDLRTAIGTTPGGRLIGVFDRADVERRLA